MPELRDSEGPARSCPATPTPIDSAVRTPVKRAHEYGTLRLYGWYLFVPLAVLRIIV